jgi:aryl-alcohol dehydrogenase-like predicted oxidoreductase
MKTVWSAVKAAFASSSSASASSSPTAMASASVDLPITLYHIPSVELNNGFVVKRIINGLWQTAGGGWGVNANSTDTVNAMVRLARSGFTTFDGADIYGPAEILMNRLRQEMANQGDASSECTSMELLTKYVPSPSEQSFEVVDSAITKSATRMGLAKGQAIDMIQFHWWDYNEEAQMLNAIDNLHRLQQQNRIKSVALTNFDTIRLRQFVNRGVPIVSNQVQYSVVDTRPDVHMAPFCLEHNIYLLTYGSVLGGLLSDAYIGAKEPTKSDGLTPSKGKYLNMIKQWGGWQLFQEMLVTLRRIGDRHGGVSVSSIGIRWVLQQRAVGAVIIGVRPGVTDHSADNAALFSFELSEEDNSEIAAVQAKANRLLDVIGDCGDEYR